MGMPAPGERPGLTSSSATIFIPALLEVAERRAPELARVGIKGSWTGYYEMSPDHNALIGEAPAPRGSFTRPASPATGSCRRRPLARWCATSCSGESRSSTCRRCRCSGSPTPTRSAPSSTSSDPVAPPGRRPVVSGAGGEASAVRVLARWRRRERRATS